MKGKIAALLVASMVAACSGGTQDSGPGALQVALGVLGGIVPGIVPGGSDPDATPPASLDQLRAGLTPERLAEIGRPVILARRNSTGGAAALVLAAQNGSVQTFVSPDGLSISLDRGLLRATRGIAPDLMASDPGAALARIRAGSGQTTRVFRWIDDDGSLLRQSVSCGYSRDGAAVVETCRTEAGAGFENRYWLSGGQIRASLQLVSAEVGHLYIESL